MCGFVGYINKEKDKTETIKKMADLIAHRGPDSEGYYCDKNIALGFRRLSIIDLKSGSQPIYNEDKSKVIDCEDPQAITYDIHTIEEGENTVKIYIA